MSDQRKHYRQAADCDLELQQRHATRHSHERSVTPRKKCSTREQDPPEAAYIYTPLHLLNGITTRLLALYPGSGNDELRGRLVTVQLSTNPAYCALSYIWGASDADNGIWLDRRHLPVRNSLWRILKRLRDIKFYSLLWVDTICIDQDNGEEKASQISFMHSIYASAKSVICFLNEGESSLLRGQTEDSKISWDPSASYKGIAYSVPGDKACSLLGLRNTTMSRDYCLQLPALSARRKTMTSIPPLAAADQSTLPIPLIKRTHVEAFEENLHPPFVPDLSPKLRTSQFPGPVNISRRAESTMSIRGQTKDWDQPNMHWSTRGWNFQELMLSKGQLVICDTRGRLQRSCWEAQDLVPTANLPASGDTRVGLHTQEIAASSRIVHAPRINDFANVLQANGAAKELVAAALEFLRGRNVYAFDSKPGQIDWAKAESPITTQLLELKSRKICNSHQTDSKFYAHARKPKGAAEMWALGCVFLEVISLACADMFDERSLLENKEKQVDSEETERFKSDQLSEVVWTLSKQPHKAASEAKYNHCREPGKAEVHTQMYLLNKERTEHSPQTDYDSLKSVRFLICCIITFCAMHRQASQRSEQEGHPVDKVGDFAKRNMNEAAHVKSDFDDSTDQSPSNASHVLLAEPSDPSLSHAENQMGRVRHTPGELSSLQSSLTPIVTRGSSSSTISSEFEDGECESDTSLESSASEGELSFTGELYLEMGLETAYEGHTHATEAFILLQAELLLKDYRARGQQEASPFRSCPDSGTSSSSHSSRHAATRDSQPSSRHFSCDKRHWKETEDEDSGEGQDRDKRRKPCALIESTDGVDSKLFACPYSKHDPERYSPGNIREKHYRHCSSSYTTNIARLKQHLYRVHKRPDHHCGRCFAVFDCYQHLENHIRSPLLCETVESPFDEKMTLDQVTLIKRRSRDSPSDVWFFIYRTLFPGSPQPLSPFAEGAALQTNRAFEPFFRNQSERLLQTFRTQVEQQMPLLAEQEIDVLDSILEECITRLNAQRVSSDLVTNPGITENVFAQPSSHGLDSSPVTTLAGFEPQALDGPHIVPHQQPGASAAVLSGVGSLRGPEVERHGFEQHGFEQHGFEQHSFEQHRLEQHSYEQRVLEPRQASSDTFFPEYNAFLDDTFMD